MPRSPHDWLDRAPLGSNPGISPPYDSIVDIAATRPMSLELQELLAKNAVFTDSTALQGLHAKEVARKAPAFRLA